MNINKTLVKETRVKKGWTQEQLAEIIGVSSRTVQRIESKGMTSMDTISALSAVFEVARENLIVDDPEISKKSMNGSLLMLLLFVSGIAVGAGASFLIFNA
ncbi:helix-turn-helix transcriptional regulator [Glaciecola petra]|uniref:Helix-turn-helix transcriptional regulator n=1 Tax=Glaciecola petra TaxID=3075602 RepID=A0ABU2ZSL0_9ALTE|nr:helix-turn-helix transcriptional regulator [Aestuariibacter sp. P117]MDT0595401.1 helix-turn-helix transcriptional regulator [Aestuariibacter sp. P117]